MLYPIRRGEFVSTGRVLYEFPQAFTPPISPLKSLRLVKGGSGADQQLVVGSFLNERYASFELFELVPKSVGEKRLVQIYDRFGEWGQKKGLPEGTETTTTRQYVAVDVHVAKCVRCFAAWTMPYYAGHQHVATEYIRSEAKFVFVSMPRKSVVRPDVSVRPIEQLLILMQLVL